MGRPNYSLDAEPFCSPALQPSPPIHYHHRHHHHHHLPRTSREHPPSALRLPHSRCASAGPHLYRVLGGSPGTCLVIGNPLASSGEYDTCARPTFSIHAFPPLALSIYRQTLTLWLARSVVFLCVLLFLSLSPSESFSLSSSVTVTVSLSLSPSLAL